MTRCLRWTNTRTGATYGDGTAASYAYGQSGRGCARS